MLRFLARCLSRIVLPGLMVLLPPSLSAANALPFPAPIRSHDETTNNRRNVLDEHPLTARPPLNPQLPKLVFFPPPPPPLGAIINRAEERDIVTGGPEQMAPFITEPFYAPVSTFISPVVTSYQGGETMTDSDRERLRKWHRERNRLLADLRERIADLTYADANTRLRDFIAFAERQKADLRALEAGAEELRERFARKSPWNERREWRLSGAPSSHPGPGMILEIQVLRAAAYYFDGLSPAQRRLLREIAMELEGEAFIPARGRSPNRQFIFLLPETARILRPDNLPESAQRILNSLLAKKARLKEELRQAVYDADAQRSTRGLRDLAEQQAPRLAELEEIAEDLRAALARVPDFPRQPVPTALPRHLIERIERYQEARRDIVNLLGRDDDEALAPLQEELDALRAAIALVPGAQLQEGTAPDAFLRNFLQARREAEAYREYDIAVLEPGLSPEQRRLLFSGAIEHLQLALPGAEEQPTLPPGTLLR